jgi:hypothetical protein
LKVKYHKNYRKIRFIKLNLFRVLMELIHYVLMGIGGILLIVLIMFIISRSKGKIEIQLDKYNYVPGETITGTVLANLKKPVHAKAFEVGLVGESDSSSTNVSRSGGISHSSKNTGRVFDFSYPIAGEGDYNPGMPPQKFQLKIPENVNTGVNTGNQAVDNVIKTAMFVTGNNRRIKWYVTGRLKIPGMDLRKKIRVNIG